jgi:hypothetical protein
MNDSPVGAERIRDENLGIEPRGGAPGCGERRHGCLDGVANGGPYEGSGSAAAQAAVTSSIRRFSSASSAAVKPSSSPARMAGRFPLVRPTRWSVTRSCGKL